ncbi:Squalene epoxidase [Coemansia javaensis]|uniref:Squalene monooxygenase n=1 Tax=Coemansia javaensis TaxID=2761396 RepID=A0A9W8HBL2_9FUNG|nr:Squalene epoxidase [Coemansia javaensis]
MLDLNADWPTHAEYEYSAKYDSRAEVVAFDAFRADAALFDHVVIGAGPIGAALAYRLARDRPEGRVLVVEKSWAEPDRIVGELMQPAGCQALERLGLGRVFSGIGAVPVHGYHISYRGRHLWAPYPARPGGGRFRGNSFHHGRLVMNLRAACKAQRNLVCLEAAATALLGDAAADGRMAAVHGVRIGPPRSDGGAGEAGGAGGEIEVRPRGLTFVCDGITSQFRRQLSPEPVDVVSHFCGFVLEHEPVAAADHFTGPAGATTHLAQPAGPRANPLPMPHNGNVLLGGAGPLLVYQVSERETRVLADLPGARLPSEAGGHLRAALRDSLARAAPKDQYPVLHAALMAALDSPRRIRCIASKYIPATAQSADGALWIGDALNVRHPLTGGGMTVGLWDVVHVTDLLRARPRLPLRPRDTRRLKAEWHWRRRPRALTVNVLSIALYSLLAAETPALDLLREACFVYVSRGGLCTMHPAALLSGMLPSPLLLVFHFFAVALLAVYLRIADRSAGPLPRRVCSALHALYVAAAVILPPAWRELRP